MQLQSLQCNSDNSKQVKNTIIIKSALTIQEYEELVEHFNLLIKRYDYVIYHDKETNRFFKIHNVELSAGVDGVLLRFVFVKIEDPDIIPAFRYGYQMPLAGDINIEIMCFNKTRKSEED